MALAAAQAAQKIALAEYVEHVMLAAAQAAQKMSATLLYA